MPSRYTQRILNYIADHRYEPTNRDGLAERLGIDDKEHELFSEAIDLLVEDDKLKLVKGELKLPDPGKYLTGDFRRHPDGVGFLVPDQLVSSGDLFVPPGQAADAQTGDRVKCRVSEDKVRAKQTGKSPYTGRVVEVLERADKKFAGLLERQGKTWQVLVDGRTFAKPVVVNNATAKNAQPGDKVVLEILDFGGRDKPAEGVITEVLGEAGLPDVETQAVMAAYGLREAFDDEVMEQARAAASKIEKKKIPADREDLTSELIMTIDPPDAKDFDDALSLKKLDPAKETGKAAWELGVHIADVAFFVPEGEALDNEAYERGNSTYLPRRVVPMLPEVLSNGVCSLQPKVNRYAKTCFIRYTKTGRVVSARFARTVINSKKRMTYLEAQALIDGDLREAKKHVRTDSGGDTKYPREVVQALKDFDELTKTIRKRRMKAGMISLGLPEVSLIYDDTGRVVDAEPSDDAYTHTLIEMCMVEANEAAARLFSDLDVPMLRRTHPEPDAHDVSNLQHFARVAGYNIPARPSRKELQELLEKVRGKPQQHAVHIAVLRTMTKAEYSPILVGHFALASEHYTHFTSPIRRYTDLVVHRAIDAVIEAKAQHKTKKKIARHVLEHENVPDHEELVEMGRHCSATERNSTQAERELRDYVVLELMQDRLGDDFNGTVSGVIGRGVFIQLDKYLIDGFVQTSDLPSPGSDRYRFNRNTNALVAERSGKTISIGDTFTVRIASVDLAKRQMELVIVVDGEAVGSHGNAPTEKKRGPSSKDRGRGREDGDGDSDGSDGRRPRPSKKKRDADRNSAGRKANAQKSDGKPRKPRGQKPPSPESIAEDKARAESGAEPRKKKTRRRRARRSSSKGE